MTEHFDCDNAISNCLGNLYEELSKANEVDIAYINLLYKDTFSSKYKLHNIEDLTQGNKNLCFKDNISFILKKNKGVIKYIKIFKYLFSKISLKIPYFIGVKYKILYHDNYRQLKKLLGNKKYDCIVSVCNPFSCHYLASRLKMRFHHIKWIAYYFDPFSFNENETHSFISRLNFENKVLKNANRIILTPKLYSEYSTSTLNKYLDKSLICEFPNIIDNSALSSNSTIEFDDTKINCVFVGYIYSNIRNPKYFLDLIVSANENIVFYVVGSSDFDMSSYKKILGDRLQLVGCVSIDEAFKIMNDADVLINIGNSVINQVPSKIFDYISTGKPIVNVCKSANCPSLEYLKKYPLSLNVFESKDVKDSDVQAFDEFCIDSKGNKNDFELVKTIYETCTPEYVANQIMNLVR